jgi:predicted DNA-binding transcriptional regulator AlpA
MPSPTRARPRSDTPAPDTPEPEPFLTTAGGDLRLIFKPELLEIVGLSFVAIWGLIRRGEFPQPRVIAGKTCWLRGEIAQWLEALPKRHYKPAEIAEEERENPFARQRRLARQRGAR